MDKTHDSGIPAVTEFIEGLFSRLGIPIDELVAAERDGRWEVSLKTPESAIAIGTNGETLRAISTLARRFAERHAPGAPHVSVDINGYLKKRHDTIRMKARMLADRARMFKYNVEMHPMNSYERMVVHAALADAPDVRTESEGEGKFRRVVIKYAPPQAQVDGAEKELLSEGGGR